MKEIHTALKSIEASQQVNILYAAESGSHAWGFASPNSDYDIRFIYAHRLPYYLSFDVELKRDVIEETVVETDLDIQGWDIRKALHLFTRSNGALLEWLRSPIVYRNPHSAITQLTELAKHAFDPKALMFHYFRTGRNNAREFLRGNTVSLKKYLYVVRCLVAVDYIHARRELPPVNFPELLKATSGFHQDVKAIQDAVFRLIQRKQNVEELGTGFRIPELDIYISNALAVNESEFVGYRKNDLRQRKWDDRLNNIFRCAIGYSDWV